MRYTLIGILMLASSACYGALWDYHPIPWDETETVASVTEAVGMGAAVPTVSYLCWNRLRPTHRPQRRLMRLGVCHLAVAGMARGFLTGPSLHDEDPRYTNVLMMVGASFVVNALIDGFRVGWWQKRVWEGIKRNSKKEK